MNKIHYFLGRFSLRYRAWYWKWHNNAYLWGIYRYVEDSRNDKLFPLTISDELAIEMALHLKDRKST